LVTLKKSKLDDGKTNYGGFMQMIQENNQVTIKFSAALGDELSNVLPMKLN